MDSTPAQADAAAPGARVEVDPLTKELRESALLLGLMLVVLGLAAGLASATLLLG